MKVKYLLKQDEDCIVNEECKSGICKNKICSYINDGDVCDGSEQCAKGSRCSYPPSSDGESERICRKYALENEACDNDSLKCLPYLTCGTDNKCVKKYSLEDGAKTVDVKVEWLRHLTVSIFVLVSLRLKMDVLIIKNVS